MKLLYNSYGYILLYAPVWARSTFHAIGTSRHAKGAPAQYHTATPHGTCGECRNQTMKNMFLQILLRLGSVLGHTYKFDRGHTATNSLVKVRRWDPMGTPRLLGKRLYVAGRGKHGMPCVRYVQKEVRSKPFLFQFHFHFHLLLLPVYSLHSTSVHCTPLRSHRFSLSIVPTGLVSTCLLSTSRFFSTTSVQSTVSSVT